MGGTFDITTMIVDFWLFRAKLFSLTKKSNQTQWI